MSEDRHICSECGEAFRAATSLTHHFSAKHKRFSLNPFEAQVSGSGQ